MTAEWVEPATVDVFGRKVSYRHPVQFTATKLSIVGVCATHDALQYNGVDTDPWPDRPGYLKRPIPKASPDESLYVWLWGISGINLVLDTCGCVVHSVVDELSGKHYIVSHPLHSKKCDPHVDDDENHTVAIQDNLKIGDVRKTLVAEDSLAMDDVDDEGNPIRVFKPGCTPKLYFDKNREIRVGLPNTVKRVAQKSELSAIAQKLTMLHSATVD